MPTIHGFIQSNRAHYLEGR